MKTLPAFFFWIHGLEDWSMLLNTEAFLGWPPI